jgi:hypothetical protein
MEKLKQNMKEAIMTAIEMVKEIEAMVITN